MTGRGRARVGFAVTLLLTVALAGGAAAADRDRDFARACIAAAEGALLDDDVSAARAWLRRVPADRRGPEWSLHWSETDRSLRVVHRAAAPLTDVAFAGARAGGGDDLLAVAAADGSVRVLDARDGTVRVAATPHRGEAWAVAVHVLRGLLASCGADGVIRLSALADGRELGVIVPGENRRATDIAFSGDGRRLAAALTAGRVRVWDLADPARPDTIATFVGHVERPPVAAVTWAGDARVASGSWDQWVKVWDVASRAAGHTLGPGYGTGAPYTRFDDLACDAGGTRLVAASARGVHGFALAADDDWLREDHAGAVTCVALRGDGELAASGGEDRTVRLWDVGSGAPVAVLRGHTGAVTAAAFGESGRLYTTAADSTLRAWDPEQAAARSWRAHGAGVWGLALSADGWTAVTCSTDDTVSVWDRRPDPAGAPRRRRAIGGFAPGAAAVVVARDGSWAVVATNGGRVERLGLVAGDPLGAYAGHAGAVPALALSADQRRLATAGGDGSLRVFDVAAGDSVRVFRPGAGRATSVAIDAAGGSIAGGFADGTVRLFTVAGGSGLRLEGPGGAVTAVAFHPRRPVVVAATERGDLRAWDTKDGREIATAGGHRAATYGLAFTPEGSRLVSASYDRTLRLWDTADWAPAGTLRGATDGLYGIAIAQDEGTIAAGGLDGRVHTWSPGP